MEAGERPPGRVVLLSGGVGGARLAAGLAAVVEPGDLTVIVNTADDFRHYGLAISPDLDTVVYTLAGVVHPETGWGRAEDTGHVMAALEDAGEDCWFFLGDRDLATHLLRTAWLEQGATLTSATGRLAQRWNLATTILPMSDDPVATRIRTPDGELPFQEWFVRLRCQPRAIGLRYEGIRTAAATPAVRAAIAGADAIVIGPSNPYLSIGPILALDGVAEALAESAAPVVAVSPLIGGQAVKGPTAQMLAELDGEASVRRVARLYAPFLDAIVIDHSDEAAAAELQRAGLATKVADILMRDQSDRQRVAWTTLELCREVQARAAAA